ncbi:MAG: ATP-binding protein [Coxiellaceae bacterium]|nr:ATP-binding protein [Coxiellaceae bacterium]
MKELLETLLSESFETLKRARNGTPRQYAFPNATNMIKVAMGMRRSGKTYFLYQTINELIDKGIDPKQILFINFEDDRLLPMNAKQMGKLIDQFYSLYPDNHQKQCYLFFDEVQNVEDWHLTVRRLYDSKDVQLYLTGSSSKLLSKEIDTSLRGRALSIEIFPYSFNEFLSANHITTPEAPFGQSSLDKMKQHLLHYFSKGGFPAVTHLPENEWRESLQSYVDTVILRDIVERHNVSNIALLKYLINTLLKNTAAPFSVNKFANDIKSQGYKVSKDTLHNYIAYIQDAYLIFTIPYYSESERIRQNQPKKIYTIDNGLSNACSINIHNNYGKLFESLVYLDLRRQNKNIYYYHTAEGYEIDFIAVDEKNQYEIIQICWDSSDSKTMEREQRAIDAATASLGIKGKIFTVRDYLKNQSCNNTR